MTEIEQLLLQLLNIPSPTGQEKQLADFIISKLSNLPLEKQDVGDGRYNIIVRKGTSKKWLVAHMDTVPGVVPVRMTDDALYGRGACDNKQSVAATILLAQKLTDINVLFTVGEEVDFKGSRVAQSHAVAGDAELVIVQEPTRFEVITGQCGVIAFSVETKGIEQHSSLPHPQNAINKLIDILSTLEKYNWHAYNVGTIQGGIAENVVPGSARALVSVRPRNESERSDILQHLKTFQTEISINKDIVPYRGSSKFAENIAPHFSEMAFFPNSIQYGAGDIRNAHTVDEHITRKELNELPDRLSALLAD